MPFLKAEEQKNFILLRNMLRDHYDLQGVMWLKKVAELALELERGNNVIYLNTKLKSKNNKLTMQLCDLQIILGLGG